jgi:hypothetical protein
MVTLGSNCLIEETTYSPFSHIALYDTQYSLPCRIASTLDIKDKIASTLAGLGVACSNSFWDCFNDHKLTNAVLPLAKTIIYCAPCVCLTQTAILVGSPQQFMNILSVRMIVVCQAAASNRIESLD